MSLRSTDRSHNRPWLSQLRYRYRGRSLALLATHRGAGGSGAVRLGVRARAERPTPHIAQSGAAESDARAQGSQRASPDCRPRGGGCETARGRCAARPFGSGAAPRPVRRARPSRLIGVRVGRSVSSQAAVASRHPACEAPRSQSHRASPEPEPAQRRRRRQGHPRNVAAAYKTHVHVSDVSYGGRRRRRCRRRRRRHNESHAATRLLLRSCAAL